MTTIVANAPPIEIGMEERERKQSAESLMRVLADTYTLYLKTQNFHWNVTGPWFQPLHALFEAQYTELAAAVDVIAERIRALGFRAPASFREFGSLTSIPEEVGSPGAEEMVRQLVSGHEAVLRTARAAMPVAERAGDQASFDAMVERLAAHEKAAWMLRSILSGS